MIYVPTGGPDDWQRLLAEPEKHWKTGYSARALAYCWESAKGFPTEIGATLAADPAFADIEPLIGIPEHQVPLPGGSRPSQNDIWVLAKCSGGLVSIAVEGKVAESFGPTVGEWSKDASAGKQERLAFLARCLGIELPIPDGIRYQLLHRTASAIIEAKRFTAPYAVMLVHSFSPEKLWLDDYLAFVSLLGGEGAADSLTRIDSDRAIDARVGWVSGDERWLSA